MKRKYILMGVAILSSVVAGAQDITDSIARKTQTVSTMQGQTPPAVIIRRGGSVRNSQLIAGLPFQSRNTHTPTRARILMPAATRSRPNIIASRRWRDVLSL